MGRRLRCKLDCLHPDVSKRIEQQQEKMITRAVRRTVRCFNVTLLTKGTSYTQDLLGILRNGFQSQWREKQDQCLIKLSCQTDEYKEDM